MGIRERNIRFEQLQDLRKAPLKKGGWGDLRVGNTYFLVAVAAIPELLKNH